MTPASYAKLAMTFTESSFLKAIQKLQVVMTICFKLFKTSVDKYIASILKKTEITLWALNRTVLNSGYHVL